MSEEQKLFQLQRDLFGSRYTGASLAKIPVSCGLAKSAMAWMYQAKGFLIITGPPGVGKTYFCSALLELVIQRAGTFRVWSERKLFQKLRESIGSSNGGDYISALHQFADDDLIIIDDVASAGYTDWREEILMELIDYRYNSRKATVFTSNLSKKEFYETYNPRIPSRLFSKENTVLDFSGMPDQRELGN